MAIRFRRSFKIAPGLKLNINKDSIGVSAGVKGAHTSINTKGRKSSSIGIPGTGLSYTKVHSNSSKAKNNTSTKKARAPLISYICGGFLALSGLIYLKTDIVVGLITLIIGIGILSLGIKKSKSNKSLDEDLPIE